MNTAQYLENLYRVGLKLRPHDEISAKNFVTNEVFNIISDIQDEKLEVTAEEIEKRLKVMSDDFSFVLKNDSVA
jgi:hypothetical protein